MTKNPYGDFYPDGDEWAHPDSYPTPHEVGRQAAVNAEQLAAQDPLLYGSIEMHMRAFAGLFNGWGNLDSFTYNRLPEPARAAARTTADASYAYFVRVGLQSHVLDEIGLMYPNGADDRDRDSYLINAMQQHVLLADMDESGRAWSAVRRGMKPHTQGWWNELPFPDEDSAAAEQERLSSARPYSEDGIRTVLRVFGVNLQPFIEGFAEVAPLNVDRRTIVHHAAGCIDAARVRPAYTADE